MSLVTEEMKAKAEVFHGNKICREKFMVLLTEIGLPINGLLVTILQDIEECGYVKEIGFVWLKHKKKKEHKLDNFNIIICYDTEITAYVEPKKIRNLKGVKARSEFLIWINLSEICVEDSTGFITFKTPAGLSRSFPVSVFGHSFDTGSMHVDQIVEECDGS